jgi:acyl-CoA thioesterase FadM
MYFSRFYELAHETYEELMRAAGLPLEKIFNEGAWGMPLVHSEADYRRPWRLGEAVHVEAEIDELTARSVSFVYRMLDSAGAVRTTVQLRHAFVELSAFKARSAPPEFAEAMRSLGLLT